MPASVSSPMAVRRAPADLAQAWAVVSFAATLLTGGWMRAAMAWPAASLGMNLSNAVHAHSHAAFFGWIVLAAAALGARQTTFSATRARLFAAVVHGIGALSAIALLAFARWGYAAPTIVLSAMHVALWFALVAVLRPAVYGRPALERWWRTAWALLLVAGALTTLPAVLAAQGIHTGWWREFGIKLFLALFVNGFALMVATGTLLSEALRAPSESAERGLDRARWLWLLALWPLGVLYVAADPPFAWLTTLAHLGVGLMGVATLWLVWTIGPAHRVPSRRPVPLPVRRTAMAGLILIGVLQLIAATGTVDHLMHARPITIAFTHLELLLVVTPLLAAALATRLAYSFHTVGSISLGAVMCAALVVIGWPWLATQASAAGLPLMTWFPVAGAAGVIAALAFLSLVPTLWRSADTPHPGGAS
ncbi:MAG: hypothetical protein K2R93_06790 [Gemmatimonadaceae bacterium]|nr:hypothetical protein [Gemmatimonadaceae bacterium]